MPRVKTSPGRAAALCLVMALLAANLAEAKIFTGRFAGQGEACWGNLFIRTKTIEWDTWYSVCQSPYVILKKTFNDKPKNFDYILYRLTKPNKACRYPYIGLYFYDRGDNIPPAEYLWRAGGFSNLQNAHSFDVKGFFLQTWSIPLSGPGEDGQPIDLLCDLPDIRNPKDGDLDTTDPLE